MSGIFDISTTTTIALSRPPRVLLEYYLYIQPFLGLSPFPNTYHVSSNYFQQFTAMPHLISSIGCFQFHMELLYFSGIKPTHIVIYIYWLFLAPQSQFFTKSSPQYLKAFLMPAKFLPINETVKRSSNQKLF